GTYTISNTCVNSTATADCSKTGSGYARITRVQTLQSFTPAMCAAAATPTLDGYTDLGTMIDERDGKSYAVRKYADGHCWMAQNLAYGTVSSAADFKTYSYDHPNAINILGVGLYGVAYSPGSNYEGYLYDWQAAMQRADTYYGVAYAGPEGVQGICPTGWHVPTGGSSGELKALSDATGTNTTFFFGGNYCASGNRCISGIIRGHNSTVDFLGTRIHIWSSTSNTATYATTYSYGLQAQADLVNPAVDSNRFAGFSIRCLADY
ncbi:hypothetical protein IJJ12_01765, partial [bacterium]|nr:hypothetical protein [bacterium]